MHEVEVANWSNGWRLVVDPALEVFRTPVGELDSALGLEGGSGSVDVLADDVGSVHQAACVALGQHCCRLDRGVGGLGDGVLLVVSLLG